jgi:hypothetical protein
MAHTYMLFDFADEETAQQARHKLETWKQAFRLDKKLQYKLDRGDEAASADAESENDEDAAESESVPAVKSAKGEKSPKSGKSTKASPQSGSKAKSKSSGSDSDDSASASGPVKLLVRLYFSGHEKKSEQRILDRINAEDLFKAASPKSVDESAAGFDTAQAHFDRLV